MAYGRCERVRCRQCIDVEHHTPGYSSLTYLSLTTVTSRSLRLLQISVTHTTATSDIVITHDRCNFERDSEFNGQFNLEQEGQHPLTGQRAANFRLLANQ